MVDAFSKQSQTAVTQNSIESYSWNGLQKSLIRSHVTTEETKAQRVQQLNEYCGQGHGSDKTAQMSPPDGIPSTRPVPLCLMVFNVHTSITYPFFLNDKTLELITLLMMLNILFLKAENL